MKRREGQGSQSISQNRGGAKWYASCNMEFCVLGAILSMGSKR